MSAKRPDRSGRRSLRFTLRWLLVVVALLSVVLAILVNPAARQRRAVARLKELGADVRYDYMHGHYQNGKLVAEEPGPPWLRKLIGIEYFATADFVFFHGHKLRNQDLEVLLNLPEVDQVNLSNSSATGAGLAHLRKMPKLTVIGLGGPNASDEALDHLHGMTQLEVLTIGQYPNTGNHVTDEGLANLVGLTNLWRLDLDDAPITDAGLVHLEGLTKLENLSLKGTKVSDEGVARIKKKLPKCEVFR